jgi:segregation and condensation protein A
VKGADRLTEAMTVWALLELYKSGEAAWQQDENFGPITVTAR